MLIIKKAEDLGSQRWGLGLRLAALRDLASQPWCRESRSSVARQVEVPVDRIRFIINPIRTSGGRA